MAERKYQTAGRSRMMEYLAQHKDRLVSAAEVYQYLEAQGGKVNITTVYRNLDKLVREGTVMKYASEKGEKCGYQYVEKHHDCQNHLHLKCTDCGIVRHLDCEFMKDFGAHILKHHGFTLQCQNSMLYGICEDCLKRRNKNEV